MHDHRQGNAFPEPTEPIRLARLKKKLRGDKKIEPSELGSGKNGVRPILYHI